MNTKTTLSITDARKKIFDIAEDVQKPGKFYTLTEQGKPKAVVMSAEQFDSLMEDLELMGDPDFAKRMENVEKEFGRGEYSSWDDVKQELGLDKLRPSLVMEKSAKSYQTKPSKKNK